MLLFGVLLVLPPGLAMLPVWLAGKPPLFVAPEALEAGAVAAAPWPAAPAAAPDPGAFVPPVEGPPDASGDGTLPLKPLLPPAGLSPAEGVRAASVPVAAAGAAPEPVLPGVLPASLLPCLPQALKARTSASGAKTAREDGLRLRPGKWASKCMVLFLVCCGDGVEGVMKQEQSKGCTATRQDRGHSVSQRWLGYSLLIESAMGKPLLAVLRFSLQVALLAFMVVTVLVCIRRNVMLAVS